jgi:hypothetical protein
MVTAGEVTAGDSRSFFSIGFTVVVRRWHIPILALWGNPL